MNGPLDVYAPPPMQQMTKSWFDTIRYEMNIRIQDGFPPFEDHVHVHEISEPGVVFQDERVKITSAVVHHPPIAPAFAFRFDGPDRSIVFSGDTSKSDALIALAKDADVLVHEVEDMNAVEKLIRSMPGRNVEAGLKHHYETHTSPEDVGKIATAANVKKLVLSHFESDRRRSLRHCRRGAEVLLRPDHAAKDLMQFGSSLPCICEAGASSVHRTAGLLRRALRAMTICLKRTCASRAMCCADGRVRARGARRRHGCERRRPANTPRGHGARRVRR